MDTEPFWVEARRRRNHQFLWWLALLPLGLAAAVLWQSVLGVHLPAMAGVFVLGLWFAISAVLFKRFGSLRCPRCGKPAFSHALFHMRHGKCQHSGLGYADG